MAEITDPEGEHRRIHWAAEQTDVATLINAYRSWYHWADAKEWASGAAFLRRLGQVGAGSPEAIALFIEQMNFHAQSRTKSGKYIYSAAKDALKALAEQGDPLAIAAWEEMQSSSEKP